jgi:hypothetical protein
MSVFKTSQGTGLFPLGTEWQCNECKRVSSKGILAHAAGCSEATKYLYSATAVPPSVTPLSVLPHDPKETG